MSESEEENVLNIFCVVYKLNGTDWEVLGKNWSQLNLYKHRSLAQYRMVAWTAGDLDIILNVSLTSTCKYKRKSPDFHKFVDSTGVTWGFGFCVKGDAAVKAQHWVKCVHNVVKELIVLDKQGPAEIHTPPRPQKPQTGLATVAATTDLSQMLSPAPPANSQHSILSPGPNNNTNRASLSMAQAEAKSSPGSQANSRQSVSSAANPSDQTLGRLEVLPEKPLKQQVHVNSTVTAPPVPAKKNKKDLHSTSISDPYSVSHEKHVSFHPEQGFQGLPAEWARELAKQYGVKLEMLSSTHVEGYNAKIPLVIISLKQLLLQKHAASTEGVFRLAPEASQSEQARKEIDEGRLLPQNIKYNSAGEIVFDYDVHVIASLIKVWLRDLPVNLLDGANKGRVSMCETEDAAWEIVNLVAEPLQSTLLFIIDICIEITKHADVNKMSPQNLAICICPNLFRGNAADPMATLVYSQKVAKFLQLAIQCRQKQK